ncbi:MAG TPA: hypothetical protein VFJ57_11825 [Solirubrobacterales bacterium]|nr:hypothetical protein [Solirubrobacterales bacterium]
MTGLTIPENVGSRQQAKELLMQLPAGLGQTVVSLDCGQLLVATPSFFDEIVKQVLVERDAKRLDLLNASPRARTLAERSAHNRGVSDRLTFPAVAV